MSIWMLKLPTSLTSSRVHGLCFPAETDVSSEPDHSKSRQPTLSTLLKNLRLSLSSDQLPDLLELRSHAHIDDVAEIRMVHVSQQVLLRNGKTPSLVGVATRLLVRRDPRAVLGDVLGWPEGVDGEGFGFPAGDIFWDLFLCWLGRFGNWLFGWFFFFFLELGLRFEGDFALGHDAFSIVGVLEIFGPFWVLGFLLFVDLWLGGNELGDIDGSVEDVELGRRLFTD